MRGGGGLVSVLVFHVRDIWSTRLIWTFMAYLSWYLIVCESLQMFLRGVVDGCRWLQVIPILVGTSFNEGFLVISKPNQIASKKSLRAHNSPKVCFVSPIICSTWYNICEECLSLSIKSCSDNDSLMTFGMVLYLVLFPPRVLSYCAAKSCLGHMSHYNMIII